MKDLDRGAHVAAVSEELLQTTLARRHENVAGLLAKGSIAWAIGNLAGTASNALVVAQYQQVVGGDSAAARRWLQVLADVEPGFATFARYMQEAVRGERAWNQEYLSLEAALEPVLCLLLLGRVEEVGRQYESVQDQETLFDPAERRSIRFVLTRHLVLASLGDVKGVGEEDYQGCKDLRNVAVFKGYQLLMLALASGDSKSFNAELARRGEAFRKRKSSRLIHAEWGFGEAASWCFDVLGTAICRLAVRHGIAVETNDSSLYPDAFWREA